ncbi:ABC transporter permease [Rhizobium sp. C4]|uniref:ABC transporter permease n=1 Tax=Rhizobium sp. C4 TaxID=1349800 RepID=UPI001E3D1421|nr:ABC transporter permease subunit [Rhizobium sp. C4]MCD2172309.1 ABC transporter permease subunit [Rhizobium sp. C4]
MTAPAGPTRPFDWRPLAVPLALITAWELAMVLGPATTSETLAAPHAVLVGFFTIVADGTLLTATAQTLGAALGGLAAAVAIGLVLGLVLGLSALIDMLLEVSIEAIRPVPSIALVPLAMMIYGFGYRMEMSIIAFTAMWPVMILTRTAIRDLEPRLLEVAKALRMSFSDKVMKIMLPAIAPRVFVALRLAAGVALVVAITVEIASNPQGLGAAMILAQQTFHPELTLAILIWIGLLGYGINHALLYLQRRLFAFGTGSEVSHDAR